MPQNAPPTVFKKVYTSLVQLQVKFELGNEKVSKPSIGQKSSYQFFKAYAVLGPRRATDHNNATKNDPYNGHYLGNLLFIPFSCIF